VRDFYYETMAPDTGGDGGSIDGLTLKAPGLSELLSTLNETQLELFDQLHSWIKDESTKQDKRNEELLAALQSFTKVPGLLGGGEIAEAASDEVSGPIEALVEKETRLKTVTQKPKPVLQDLMKLPVEFSMGYIYLGNKFDEMIELMRGKSDGEAKGDSKSGEAGNFLQGLLQGAGSIALLAASMALFATSAILFSQVDWPPALAGMFFFALFVAGAIAVARSISTEMENFKKFAMGVLLLTAGLAAFSVAVIVAAFAAPFLPDALWVITAFAAFLSLAIVVARSVGENMEHFVKFGLGMMALTGSLILFAGAIFIMAWVNPYIGEALPGLALATAFMVGMTLLAWLVTPALPAFVAFGAGMLLLMVALAAFGGVIFLFAQLLPVIESAGLALQAISEHVIDPLWNLMWALGNPLMMAAAVLFTATTLIMTPGALLWAATLAIYGSIPSETVEIAGNNLAKSGSIVDSMAAVANKIGFNLIALTAMGVAMVSISAGFILFSEALQAVAKINPIIPAAMDGLNAIGRFMFGSGFEDSEAIEEAGEKGGASKGFLAFLDSFEGKGLFGSLTGHTPVFDRMKAFGNALRPFSEGMIAFADALERVAQLRDVADEASQGLLAIMKVIIGDGTSSVDSAPSVLKMLDSFNEPWFGGASVFDKLQEFSSGLGTFSEAMDTLMGVFEGIVGMNEAGTFDDTRATFMSIINLLVGGAGSGSLLQLINQFQGGFFTFGDNVFAKLGEFSDKIAPFFSSLGAILNTMVNLAASAGETGGVGQALADMRTTMVEMLGSPGSGGITASTNPDTLALAPFIYWWYHTMSGYVVLDKVGEFGTKMRGFSTALELISVGLGSIAQLDFGDDERGETPVDKLKYTLETLGSIDFASGNFDTLKDRLNDIKQPIKDIGEAFKMINDNVNEERLERFFDQLDRGNPNARPVDSTASDVENDPTTQAVMGIWGILQRWDEGAGAGAGENSTETATVIGSNSIPAEIPLPWRANNNRPILFSGG
jgi:hypothetical protein